MNKTDAKCFRDAAELIASKEQEFCCCALEGYYNINRPDLVPIFREIFRPSKEVDHYIFWNEEVPMGHITHTNNREHSRECRILALLLMAEMIENP